MPEEMTPSADFFDRLHQAIGEPLDGHPEEARTIAEGQTAAAWFYSNRVQRPRRICVVECGPASRNIRIFEDMAPDWRITGQLQEITRKAPHYRNLDDVAQFVKLYVLGE
ncbi:MAG: hypothetical protein U0414_21850 [Polyangiaceae bacterium]